MTKLLNSSNFSFPREVYTQQKVELSNEPLIINLGQLYITIGFPGRRILKIVSAMARQKSNEPTRIGNNLSFQEVLKSAKSPFQDGVVVFTDILKDLVEACFVKIFPPEIKQMRAFPFKVVFVLSRVQPKISQDYIRDIFENYFGCKDFRFLYTEDLVDGSVLLNFGHLETTASFGGVYYSLGYGSHHITLLIQQHLQAKYKFFAKNMTTELAEFIKRSCCTFEPFCQEDEDQDFGIAYQAHYNDVLRQIRDFYRPTELISALSTLYGRVDYANFYGYQLLSLKSHFALLQTTLPFVQLFSQEQLKGIADFAEKARAMKIYKVVNLAHFQGAQELENLSELEQLKVLYANTEEAIKHYSAQLRMFERHKQIGHLFDHAYSQADFGDQYVDLPKVLSHLNTQYNEVSSANAICYIKLADLGWVEDKKQHMPQLYYYFDGAASIDGNVLLPVFGEQFFAQEVYFQPYIIGQQGIDVGEAVGAVVQGAYQFEVVCIGGGCGIPGMQRRLLKELRIMGCTRVTIADEWELISQKVSQQ